MAPEDQAASHHPNGVLFCRSVGFLEPPPTTGSGGSSFPWIMVASVHFPLPSEHNMDLLNTFKLN